MAIKKREKQTKIAIKRETNRNKENNSDKKREK